MEEITLPLVEPKNETLEIKFKTAKGILGKRIAGLTEAEVDELIHTLLEEDKLILELLR